MSDAEGTQAAGLPRYSQVARFRTAKAAKATYLGVHRE